MTGKRLRYDGGFMILAAATVPAIVANGNSRVVCQCGLALYHQ
jgi:hypothetical protein